MNDNEEWGEIEPVETEADDFGEVEPLRWEDGDGGSEKLPDGEHNQWGGNLRNDGRRVLLRRDKNGKVNGYSTTSSMLVRHDDGKFAVVPTVVGGKELSADDAVKHYAKTGEHWGMADNEDSARKMVQEVHDAHMKGNQAKWNDWLHEHWDEVSDDIRNDRGMAYEHKKRTAPDKITLMERLANDDTDDERRKKEQTHHWQVDYSLPSMSPFGMGMGRPKTARKYDDKAQMDDLAEIAAEAGLSDWQVKRIRSESKTPEEMREALAYVAGNRPVRDGETPEQQTVGWRSVPKTIVNTAGNALAGFINLVGTVAGGVDEDARHAYMADDPMAKKEGESFDDWLGRVHIDEKVKRMSKRNPAVRENLERYYKWEAPIAGKEGMHQEHSVMVQNGREGTGVGNLAIRDAKRLRNWINEKSPVGNSGNAVVDWLEGAASGIAQFAYLGPTMIAMSAADSYQQSRSMSLESGRTGGASEALATGNALFDGTMTAAFYYAPFRRWMNGKGIVPVQPVEKFTFSGLSKAMGRFNAKREFLNQGAAALEAGGIMGIQGAGDTAFRQLASGGDLDLGEITIEGAKSGLDGIAIGAIMGAGRILNARIRGERDYEKVVRAAAQSPEGRLMLARFNPDGMMDLKRFVQEGIDIAKAHEKPAADFEADTLGRTGKGRAPAPDWKPTEETLQKFQELCDKAGLPPDAKLATDILFDPNVANFLGDALNSRFAEAARTCPGRTAIPESPIIDAETGKVVEPSQALAKKIHDEFGQEPAKFTLPQTADGKPSLTPMKWRDNRTGKENTNNIAHDPQTGVTIMEEADGTFSVHNDTGDSDGAKTIAEAVEKAKELALMGQYTELDRRRKRTVIENERATKYGKKNVAYFNTMTEAAEAIENGIARSGGRFLGLESADQLRDPSVQDRDAFYTPDGTTVVILDNVHEVGDISRILAHEIVGHGGPNGEFGRKHGAQVKFAENIRAKQFDEFKKQVVDGNLDYVKASSMDAVNRNLGEVFAHYASANLEQEPSTLNKLISKVNDAARKVGMRKTYSASDVKTMLARWREAVKGTGGDTIDLTDASPRFDFFPVEPPERPVAAPGAQGEAKAGIETAKPPEAPVGDSGASGAMPVEPRRMTSAEAAKSGNERAKPTYEELLRLQRNIDDAQNRIDATNDAGTKRISDAIKALDDAISKASDNVLMGASEKERGKPSTEGTPISRKANAELNKRGYFFGVENGKWAWRKRGNAKDAAKASESAPKVEAKTKGEEAQKAGARKVVVHQGEEIVAPKVQDKQHLDIAVASKRIGKVADVLPDGNKNKARIKRQIDKIDAALQSGDLSNDGTVKEIATALHRLKGLVLDIETDEGKEGLEKAVRHIEKIESILSEHGFEVVNPTGRKVDDGDAVKIIAYEGEGETEIYRETLVPTIRQTMPDGKVRLVQMAEVIVGRSGSVKNASVSAPQKTEATTPPTPAKPAGAKEPAKTTQKRVDAISSKLGIPITVVGKDGKVEADSTAAAEAAVSGKQATQKAAPKPRTPSIKMKDEAAEKLAQKQEDELAALFDTPELGIIVGDESKHRLRGRPSGLVDKLFHPFSSFLSSHHGVEIDRRNGTPVGIGIVRDAFEAFAPDEEQRALASALFDVAEKLGVDFKIDHRQPTDAKGEQAYEIGGHITLHADELDKRLGKDVCDAILHEITHGVTSYAINISNNEGGVEGVAMPHALHDAVRRLRAAFTANRDLLPGDDDYRNLHEFAARLTEPDFRSRLERRGWLRRIIDAVVDMFKALFGKPKATRTNAEYDRAINALRGILENYDKTAFDVNRAAAEDALVNPNFSIRKETPPKRTGVGYKVFVRGKDGNLYPPMVANPNGEATPVGVWLNADEGVRAGTSKAGRDKVKAGGKGTNGGGGTLAWRPGWHLGEIPYALQFNVGPKVPNPLGIKNAQGDLIKVGEFFPGNFVWAEVEYAADVDYQEEAMSYGRTASGKFNHALAGLPRLPVDGSYKYRTNANPATDPWVITGAMKVNRVLSNDEVDAIVRKAGRQPQKRESDAVQKFLAWAKKWKLDPSKQKVRDEWMEKNGVSFDTPDFDVDAFQKRVDAVANLVKTYRESGVAEFKTLATRMVERFPEKFPAMKPYLRGVWNAVADQMDLPDISRNEAERIYGIIETNAKEVEDGRELRSDGSSRVDSDEGAGGGRNNGVRPDAGVSAAGEGAGNAGGVLADGVRDKENDRRVDGGRSGTFPGQPEGRIDQGNAEVLQGGGSSGRETSAGDGSVGDSVRSEEGERETGRYRAGDGDNPKLRVKKAAKKAADDTKPNPPRRDFVMTKAVEEAILEKKTVNRVRNNLDAIKLIRELKARDYAATPEEQAALAKFVGWGGLREAVFGYDLERAYDLERSGEPDRAATLLRREGISQSAYELHKELRQVLNDKEYESAKESASTAFYTPIEFVRVLHETLRRLGVKGGRFLGPSAGTGNFASAAGAYEKPVNWQFVEKDAMTGEILKALFPNQHVTIGGFEDTKFPDDFFDFAIDNVPYADVPINDRSLSSRMFKIHDYFFAKTLAKLRPGGVMAFLTSTGTLDKTSPILRQFLTEHGGRIVGAVRLPNGFFSENAGTDVASDLVIVQKVQGKPDNSAFEKGVEYGFTAEWVRRKGQVKEPLTYNGYFKDHPEQIVGEMTVGSGQFGPTLQYKMPPEIVPPGGKGLWEQMNDAVSRAFAGVDKNLLLKEAAVAEKQDHTPIYDDEGLRQGNVTMKDGKPFIKSGDMLEPIELPKNKDLKKKLAKRLRTPNQIMDGLLALRKAMRDVIDTQMAESDGVEADLAPLWAKLNEAYDAFVKKNGSLHDKWISPFVMLDKADGNRLLALERIVKDENSESKIVKSDIFSKRVISRGQRATKAETPKDALVISYSETGMLDVPRIAELLGVDANEAIAKLKEGGDVFENPQTGLLEPSWGYLSGRVRAKLAAARAAVEAGEEGFRANVEALEKVQPPMVRLEDAEIKFGATWVDPECMADFLRDAFGSEHMRISLSKNEVTGQWNVEFGHIMNEDPWGETSWDPKEFVSRVLNHGSMNHYVTDPVDKKRYLDERRTEANKLAAEKLHSAFSQFIQSSEKWATPMYERYNAVMTDMVEIQLPNNILPFRSAGMSEDALGKLFEGGDPKTPKKGREYQSAVIARGVLGNGSLCLAHCVGAGKTLEMQSIGVLGRHLGLFKKPMYVVPNHMLEQFTNEFVEAFPNANILKMSEDDVKPENRRAFFAQVANGDWDAIVVKHSTFSKKLAMSDEYQKEFLEAQVKDLDAAIEAMREAGEKISVDQATKKKQKLQAKLEKLINAENHDSQIVPFEELGVDQLFVDEAHNFKGMQVTTRQNRVKGLQQGDSQRATDMQMKTQYVQSLHGGDRGVVFATGTPLSNAPVVEAYVMLKYLAPNKLQEQGLTHFDDFVNAFGRITTESIPDNDGKTFKEKDMVTAFVNIPEMMKLFRSVVDIVNADQLDIARPTPKYHMIDVEMSPAQERIMEAIAREAGQPASKEWRSKYLDSAWVGKLVCISPKLLGIDETGNKILRAVSEIKKIHDETANNKGAQLVFTDRFEIGYENALAKVLSESETADFDRIGKFNLNEEIRDLLVQAGIPKGEIAIIQDIDKSKGDKDANKAELFAKVRSGEVRVLIGSRPKMGEGTNVQKRLAAIHLLHPGWKPSEDEQAIGRIIRYGNTYKEGQIFYYITKGNANIGSYEMKNHDLIGRKSKLIDQVMHGDETVRTVEMDESAMDRDMLMGLASGNKALIELIDVKKHAHKLELNTESTANSARRNKDKAEANARILERRREEFAKEQESVKEWREKNDGKPFTLSTPDGRSIEKVKDMAEYVSGEMAKLLTQDRYDRSERTVLGNFNGVELVLAYDKWGDEKFRVAVPLLGLAREVNYSGFVPDFSQAAMTAFKGKIFETVSPDFAKAYENSLADMDRQAKKMSADADRLQKDYETMRGELIKLRHRQAELERAVTPLVIQTVEKRNVAAYGNWAIVKERNGHGYVAQREADAKRLTAPTVKELIPLMNAEDFANPKNAAIKTSDLMPRLKPDAKGIRPSVETLSVEQVDFDTPELTAAEEKYAASEDQTPTEDIMREVYGMTNDDIATAMKAAGMEPPKHVRKSDATAWQQAEALLSNPSYMAKLSRAVARFPRNIADYENNALNVLFRQRQNAVNEAQNVVDGLKETLDAFDAIPKDERDTVWNDEQKKTATDYAEAKAKLAQAKALMFETGTALTRSASEAGRRLRSNRGLIDQTDYSYAGISGEVSALLGGADKITPEMDEKIREIAGNFASLDEAGRDLATARLKAHVEKIVEQIKNGDKMRKMAERKPGDEAKRVMRNYNDALAQIEVGAAEVGGTLVGLSDQQYPAWGKWLRAIGEFHCFENPDITEEECIKAIVEDISPFMDGVDENQVRDALTGFGHNFRQSRYDSQRLMNDLRSQSRMKRQLDWMDETNTMPPLTGLVRDEPSDTTRNLQKQVQERKKEVPDAGRDERRLKGVLESAKTRVRNRIADLERAIATGEKIPGRERTVLEDIELREMKKRKDVLQKEYDELFKTEKGMTEEQRIKFAEKMLGRELEHALEDLDRARSGDFSKRPKRPGVESPTLDVLRARLAEIRGQIHDLKLAKYEFGMTPEELDAFNARKMANREKAVARLAERIVRGDLRPQKKPQPPMPPEMQKRYDELAEQMSRAHRKLADLRREAADARKPKFVRFIGDAYRFVDGVWKMATASLDFTQVGNQTGSILMAHPKLVAENFAKTLSAFKNTANAEAIELELLSEPSVKEAVDNGWLRWKKVSDSTNRGDRVELFDAIDKPFTIGGKALRLTDIPYYGTAIANSDRLYATYINAASASLYSTIVNDPKLFPGGASVFQKKMLCDMINVMNGSGSLSNDNRRMLGKVFWAPGLVDSQLKRLIGYQIWHPWTASAEEDGSGTFAERLKMSRIGLGEFVRSNLGAILLGSLLMALFSTDDQKDEFAHAGAVKKLQTLVAPRIRHTQLDFTGGSVAFLRLGNRLVSGAYETATGKQAKVRDTFGEVAHFAKGRLTPLVSNLFSALSGKGYTGQDYGAAELLLSFAPISLRDAGKSIYENGIEDREWGTAFLGAGLTMFGIGKGTYRKDDYKILTNRFLESKKEFDAIESDDLIDEDNKRLMLDSIIVENPLMRAEVRKDIAADIAQIRKDEARARKDEKEGYEADTALLSDIERGKAAILEKIRRSRR